MFIDRGMYKEDVIHIYSGMLLSHRKEWTNAIYSNMNGPRDDHTKWSQAEKDKYCMVWLICGIFKWTDLQTLKTNMVTKGEGSLRGGVQYGLGVWEWQMHTLYMEWVMNGTCSIAQENPLSDLWWPIWEWKCVYVWQYHFAIWQKLTQYCKSTILQ